MTRKDHPCPRAVVQKPRCRAEPIMTNWRIFTGSGEPHDDTRRLPAPPQWRRFSDDRVAAAYERQLGEQVLPARLHLRETEIDVINAALYLRRPLLVTGKPG